MINCIYLHQDPLLTQKGHRKLNFFTNFPSHISNSKHDTSNWCRFFISLMPVFFISALVPTQQRHENSEKKFMTFVVEWCNFYVCVSSFSGERYHICTPQERGETRERNALTPFPNFSSQYLLHWSLVGLFLRSAESVECVRQNANSWPLEQRI
jgi:hypothetical protein